MALQDAPLALLAVALPHMAMVKGKEDAVDFDSVFKIPNLDDQHEN